MRQALSEDLGSGDLTCEAVIPADAQATAEIQAKASGRIAGGQAATLAFQLLDPSVECTFIPDGSPVEVGDVVAQLSGRARALLSAERVALNMLQHLSGIATATAEAVAAAEPYGVRIVDTRKTTPGLRALEKSAVRAGGGSNHRFGLYDAVMLKENHIAVAGGIVPAVQRARERIGHMVKIEVEIESLHQIDAALEARADVILLDNMSLADMRAAVAKIDKRATIEASGGITPDRVAEVAACGVDVISIGWITHSVPALDLSLRVVM